MIIYTYPLKTAFTERDVEMLQSQYKVKSLAFTVQASKLPLYFLIQLFQLIYYLPKTSHYLCFFGGYHSVLPTVLGKIFRKKVFIQCGGTDAMNMPEINYGNFRKKWLKMATIFSFKNCSKILPVANALVLQDYTYDPRFSRRQGLHHLIPDLKTTIEVVHNGFDTSFWKDHQMDKKPFSFITVAAGITKQNRAAVKGIDLVLEMARGFPQYHFTLVGDSLFECDLPNVRVIGKLNSKKLKDLFNKHQFYLQLSLSEGFPNALAEAMLCGCIPIGSSVGAIPEIIGDYGFILDKKDPILLQQIFHSLNNHNLTQLRKEVSSHIQRNFPYSKRQKALLSLFEQN